MIAKPIITISVPEDKYISPGIYAGIIKDNLLIITSSDTNAQFELDCIFNKTNILVVVKNNNIYCFDTSIKLAENSNNVFCKFII